MVSQIRVRLQLFAQERTETATPRRRQEARRKGQVARTAELSSAMILMAGFSILYFLASYVSEEIMVFTRHIYEVTLIEFDVIETGQIPSLFHDMILLVVRVVSPVIGVVLFAGFFSQLFQVGFLTAQDPLKPQLQRISPVSGFKRIFSKRAVVELFKSTLKIAVIGYVVYLSVRGSVPAMPQFMELEPTEVVIYIGILAFRVGLWVSVALLVLSIFDYAYQRWEFEQSIKMSKQEVREEVRQTEGDPQIRSQIRQRQRQIAGMRMMAQVPTADVVITNPVHLAVALSYQAADMEAPVVIAKGAGPLANRIKETAREHGITLVENVWLARSLYETAQINARIPEELYQAVAEVLAFVYRLKRAGGTRS